MIAFAANSLLCRLALRDGAIDAASFTTLRLASGALALWGLVSLRRCGRARVEADWLAAAALFAYAAAFSLAYRSLDAATGALLLFSAVQTSMVALGLRAGERLATAQLAGMGLALGGLVGLLAPGLSAPPLAGASLMLAAGAAWGVYSWRGRRGLGDPVAATAGNFVRALPFTLAWSVAVAAGQGLPATLDAVAVACAVASGALASGGGYALWYAALPGMRATTAATAQLSVPVLTALAGIAWLGEPLTLRLVLAAGAILGGIALVVRLRR